MKCDVRTFIAGFIVVMVVSSGGMAQQMAKVEKSFDVSLPGKGTSVWGGNAMWLLDLNNKKITKLDSERGRPIDSLNVPLETPQAFVWADDSLWVIDQNSKMIYKLNPRNGNIVRSIKAPEPQTESEWSYEALAWDGHYLWVAYFAGFSSKIVKVDPKDGSEVLSFFCDCHPRGLASDGKKLYSISYNGEGKKSKIDERTISDKPVDMINSRAFTIDLPPGDPSGLSYDGTSLRYFDRQQNKIFKLAPTQ